MSQLRFRTPKGTNDQLPEDHQYLTYIKKALRHRGRQAGFQRISTPMFENRAVFERGIGEHTDIVEKELFKVVGINEERELALRPEFTAGICRAYVEHAMDQLPQPVQLFSFGKAFRYERPQKGRYREFHQIDLEVIGISDPSIDAQLVEVAVKIYKDLQIWDRLVLQVNNIGTSENRQEFCAALQDFFTGKERNLPDLDRERLKTNPLRLLDSKEEDTQILLNGAPKLEQFISPESKEFHKLFLEYLDILGIAYEENPGLVRGFDYYNQTVFEFWDIQTRGKNAVGGGGRYDGLVELMGGKPTPAVGCGLGVERIIWHMKEAGVQPPMKDQVDVFLIQIGPAAKKKSLPLLSELRELGVHTVGALGEASIKSQLRLADKFNAKYTLIMGQLEVKEGTIILRDMVAGKQKAMKFEKAVPSIIKLIGKENLDTYSIQDHLGDHVGKSKKK